MRALALRKKDCDRFSVLSVMGCFALAGIAAGERRPAAQLYCVWSAKRGHSVSFGMPAMAEQALPAAGPGNSVCMALVLPVCDAALAFAESVVLAALQKDDTEFFRGKAGNRCGRGKYYRKK